MTTIRYVDLQITRPHFAGDPSPAPLVDPPEMVSLDSGETIIGVREFTRSSGTLGHDVAMWARVWIAQA